ncbi:MAG: outer membrane protein assembly factor BamA [Myxococcaceae bacterium]|nr:outer membrane protein assembly factor BamA [Myxococcaceae bacterium]
MTTTRAIALLLLLLGAAPASAQPADAPTTDSDANVNLTEVRVEGNRRVEVEAIKRALRNKVGRPFDATKTGDDLKSLWALNYFDDLKLLVQRLPQGGVVYVVRVTERPAVREVKLSGNDELSKDDFKESIDIRPYSILDVAAVRRNLKKIQDKYVEKGFFLAEVTYELTPVSDSNEVDVIYVIKEHAKVQVKEINFLGAKQVPAEELKAVMATHEGGYFSFFTNDGTYREEMFQRDLQVIQSIYYDHGFINVKVEKPIVSLSPDKRNIYITIKVEEGEQYNIGKLDFSGDLLVGKDVLAKKMVSEQGSTFNRSTLGKDIQAITDVYYDEGYAYANITPVTALHADSKTIDLTFDVQKGSQVTIERIDIIGNTKTRDKVIRRHLKVYEGELFSGSGMRRSKEKVTQLGFFETVEVTHKPGSDKEHVVIQVEVKEKSTGTFQVGLGFSNAETFIFTAQVAQNNFLGWGQTVSASAQLSGLRQFLQLQFFDPYFLDTNFIFSTDFYRTQADYFGFVRNATGGSLGLGYYVMEDVSVNVGYTREYVQVEPGRDFDAEVPLANQFRNGAAVTSALRLTAQWDRRNNRIYPSSGFLQFASVEFAPKFLGGDLLFTRYSAYSRFYFPLPLGIVLKTNATIGYIAQLDPLNPLPISEQYFLGGIQTVRGYTLRSLTPRILVGSSTRPDTSVRRFPVGGNKQFFFNLEIEFPIFEKVGIRGVLFYDAGNVFAADAKFFQDDTYKLPLGLFHSVGFGFRWFSPIGPLRFEWGIPLNRRADSDPPDQPILFEFTIGNSF